MLDGIIDSMRVLRTEEKSLVGRHFDFEFANVAWVGPLQQQNDLDCGKI